MNSKGTGIIALALWCTLLIAGQVWGGEPAPDAGESCEVMLTTKCNQCHDLDRICVRLGHKNLRSWKRTIKYMAAKWAAVTDDPAELFSEKDKATLLDCLYHQKDGARAACR